MRPEPKQQQQQTAATQQHSTPNTGKSKAAGKALINGSTGRSPTEIVTQIPSTSSAGVNLQRPLSASNLVNRLPKTRGGDRVATAPGLKQPKLNAPPRVPQPKLNAPPRVPQPPQSSCGATPGKAVANKPSRSSSQGSLVRHSSGKDGKGEVAATTSKNGAPSRRCNSLRGSFERPPAPEGGGGGAAAVPKATVVQSKVTVPKRSEPEMAPRQLVVDGGTTTPRDAKIGDEEEECSRQMFDKNTLRLEKGAILFRAAISKLQNEVSEGQNGVLHGLQKSLTFSNTNPIQNYVQVFVRKRPIFEKDLQKGDYDAITVMQSASDLSNFVVAHDCRFEADLKTPFIQHHSWYFDRCFDEQANNEDVYQQCMLDSQHIYGKSALLRHVLEDRDHVSTIFMLGQTGSGKTHTMTSLEMNIAQTIFSEKQSCRLRFLEIRQHKVLCLFGGDSAKDERLCVLREGARGRCEIEGATPKECSSAVEMQQLIRLGHSRRTTERTLANDVSSRSHCMCIIDVEDSGRLVLVDCAGTERKKDAAYHTKERQQEGAEINASMFALKECIRYRFSGDGKVPHQIYRASNLTKLLAEAFLADDTSQMAVICTLSPCASDVDHTITTLRTGFQLSGRREANFAKVVKQGELAKFVNMAKRKAVPVNKWTATEVSKWVAHVLSVCKCPDALETTTATAACLPSGTTGQMLRQMPENRFVQVFGDKIGPRMFAMLREEVQSPTTFLVDA
jgi:kinesin family protein 2/24